MTQMWDENVDEAVPSTGTGTREPVDLDTLDDGRCKASSWRVRKPATPTYENHFGPGGFNRCLGSEGHVNRLHKDDWGHVFAVNEDGSGFLIVRDERPPAGAPAPLPRPPVEEDRRSVRQHLPPSVGPAPDHGVIERER